MQSWSMRDSSAGGCCVVGVKDMASDLLVRRLPIRFEGDDRRVILRPFVLSNSRVRTLFDRLEPMYENTAGEMLVEVGNRESGIPTKFHSVVLENFGACAAFLRSEKSSVRSLPYT